MTENVSMPKQQARDACGSPLSREGASVSDKSVDVKPDSRHIKSQNCLLEQPSSGTGDMHQSQTEDTRHLVPSLQGRQKRCHLDDYDYATVLRNTHPMLIEVGRRGVGTCTSKILASV